MLNWGNQGWQLPRIGGFPNIREPRTDSERTDQIMRILSAGPGQSSTGRNSSAGWPNAMPDSGRRATSVLGFDGGELADVGTEWASPLGDQSVRMASVAAIPAGLQIGQAGIAALRALGPLAAATLAAILKAFRDTLGRQPTPTELDNALRERAQQQGSTVARDRPGAPPDKPECEDQLKIESAYCSEIAKKYDRQAGAICGHTAMDRYSECLRFGSDGVRTPLYQP